MILAGNDPYVKLAARSCKHYVEFREFLPRPDGLPEEMLGTRAGCFVSLHKGGALRGCIGTISPVQACLADEIIHNAVSAAAFDPRFNPVRQEEFRGIAFSVDVLEEPEDIQSQEQLDPLVYGVIVSSGIRRGLLLPNLEGISTAEEQVGIARRKAGIGMREPVSVFGWCVTNEGLPALPAALRAGERANRRLPRPRKPGGCYHPAGLWPTD